MRTIRLDDYPSGCPGFDIRESRAVVRKVLAIFEAYQVPYILGATPLLMNGEDCSFLNEVAKTGRIVMHGFNHAFDFQPWERITETWPKGGEFWDMGGKEITISWAFGNRLLRQIRNYDPSVFIPPFNCVNQAAINALSNCGVKTMHTCSKEWDAYNYAALDWKGMEPVVPRYQETYHDADKVLEYLEKNPEDQGQITLHWIFDQHRAGWEMDYENLARWVKAHG